MRDPYLVKESILDAYIKYIQTPFAFRSDELEREREELLRRKGLIFQEPRLEPILGYESSGYTLKNAAANLNLSSDLADFIYSADKFSFFPSDRELYTHQYDSLENFGGGNEARDVVITTGTGSGKTETFFLPIINSLIEESKSWGQVGARRRSESGFQYSRIHEEEVTDRVPAIRALVLYPLNALIEDQLARLRKALDSKGSRDWLDANRKGNRFYFGRYTGKTPVSGVNNTNNWRKLREYLNELRETNTKLRATDGSEDYQYFFQSTDIDSSEMISRWDMQMYPPDILVTNYSMLNIMLMRSIEGSMFDQTRAWLENPDNTFYLVVDELHTYRGTAGSEVAYLFRVLLDRLGLSPTSEQLKVISASASIAPGESGQEYLKELFGRTRDFYLIGGNRKSLGKSDDIKSAQELLQNLHDAFSSGDESVETYLNENKIGDSSESLCHRLTGLTESLGLHKFLSEACIDNEGNLVALTASEISDSTGISERAVKGLVQTVCRSEDENGNTLLPVRCHLFFKNLEGVWACSSNQCTEVHSDNLEEPNQLRNVGKIYGSPSMVCGCGNRILQMLYCQTCGDEFVAGFRNRERIGEDSWILSPYIPDLESLPERLLDSQVYSTYAVVWPSREAPIRNNWTERGQRRRWVRAILNPTSGEVRLTRGGDHNCWLYWIESTNIDQLNTFSWKPKYCPNCDDHWASNRDTEQTTRSPIRHLGTGLQKITQVLSHNLMEELDEERRKLVVFSDSRSDAAKISSGVKTAHYQDLTRLIAFLKVESAPQEAPAADYVKLRRDQNTEPEVISGAAKFQAEYPNDYLLVDRWIGNEELTGEELEKIEDLTTAKRRPVKLTELTAFAEERLASLGVNPGGYRKRVLSRDNEHWSNLYRWHQDEVVPKVETELSETQGQLRESIHRRLRQQLFDVLFAKADMGYESVGLGWVAHTRTPGLMQGLDELKEQVLGATIRILGERKRFVGGFRVEAESNPPRYLRDYLAKVAETNQVEVELLIDWVSNPQVAGLARGFMIVFDELFLVNPNSDESWVCTKCSRLHLQPSGGICTRPRCLGELEYRDINEEAGYRESYYAQMARRGRGFFRLHSEELSAQTDKVDQRKRQRLFQDVVLQDENRRIDEIDMLSVTTTMEAGVDIGNLDACMMANMPPKRFNYQQRAGRAGRRNEPLSVVLTLCRLRSHDEFYFARTNLITNEVSPSPYIDLNSIDIVKRVLVKELLRRSYGRLDLEASASDSVHGEFGPVSDFSSYRDDLARIIRESREEITRLIEILCFGSEIDSSRREALGDWASNQLIDEVSVLVEQRVPIDSTYPIGQLLAEKGLLPMFGFPTRVRYLYHRAPRSRPWPPETGVIDRDIDIAIGQFAPGSETVKDDQVHTSVGLVQYQPIGGTYARAENGLGQQKRIGLCRHCKSMVTDLPSTNSCPVCDNSTSFQVINAVEPLGFCTDFYSRDYDGQVEWGSSSTHARVASNETSLQPQDVKNVRIWTSEGEKAELISINDNNGRLFQFRPDRRGMLICEDAVSVDENDRINLVGSPVSLGLMSAKVSDLLAVEFIRDNFPSWLNISPAGTSRDNNGIYARAALYSFGFLLRRSAAVFLDIDEREISVGIKPVRRGDSVWGQVFLCDSLENGAGYCRFLSNGRNFEELLEFGLSQEFLKPFTDHEHASQCQTACYDCMLDYGNMSFHGLLDWRLGVDLLRLASNSNYEISINSDLWSSLSSQVLGSLAMGLPPTLEKETRSWGEISLPGLSIGEEKGLVICHPLWLTNRNVCEQLAGAIVDIQEEGREVVFANIFDVLRRPAKVIGDIQ